jgi:Ala-tRNA(Pro) deacylase
MTISTTVRAYIDRAGIEYNVVTHPYSETSMRTAEAAHVSGEVLAKAVLLKDDAGYVLAVLPATHQVRVGEVQRQLERPLETAPEVDLGVVFPDCAPGALPALGPAYELETIVDASLRGHSEIYFEAGDHEELIRVSGGEFEALLDKARFLSFSAHRQQF